MRNDMKWCAIATSVVLASCSASSGRTQAITRPEGAPDSIVLRRKDDLCLGPCKPIPDVVLRRGEVSPGVLEAVVMRARSAGFYDLPQDVRGKAEFCQVVMSDSRMATLAIFHADGAWSVSGYHHCLRGRDATHASPRPEEKKRLLALEALVDSVALTLPRR